MMDQQEADVKDIERSIEMLGAFVAAGKDVVAVIASRDRIAAEVAAGEKRLGELRKDVEAAAAELASVRQEIARDGQRRDVARAEADAEERRLAAIRGEIEALRARYGAAV